MRNINQSQGAVEKKAAVEKLPIFVKSLFYLYLSLLPLLAFWALYLNKPMWAEFMDTGDPISAGKGFFIVFTFIGIFLSGIFALLIVQNTPLPKKLLPAIFAMFDVPIQVAISVLLGNEINASQVIVIDFTLELVGLIIGITYMRFISKQETNDDTKIAYMLLIVFGLIILFSEYGKITYNYISTISIGSQIPIYTGVITTVIMYIRTFKQRGNIDIGNIKEEQGIMSNFASVAMIALWISMVLIIFL